MKRKLVLAQTKQNGDVAFNLQRAENLVVEAVKEYHPQGVVFPEYYMSHYPLSAEKETVVSVAEPLDGPFVQGMQEIAKENGVWLIFGMRETTGDPSDKRNYNTIVVLDDEGAIQGTYRKVHLYNTDTYKEEDTVKAGKDYFTPIKTPFGIVGIFVCYEIRIPEVAKHLKNAGADLLIMPTAWVAGPDKREQFRSLLVERAQENKVYLAACNQCGEDTTGESALVDPAGNILAVAGWEEELLYLEF